MAQEPGEERGLAPVGQTQEIRKVRTPPLVITVDESKFQALKARAQDLRDRYQTLLEKEGDSKDPEATPNISKRVLNAEFSLRMDYETTREIIGDMVNGYDFRIAPQVDEETGLVTRVNHETADENNQIIRSGYLSGLAQTMIDIITVLGVEHDPKNPSVPGVILRPNLPKNIDKPIFEKIAVKSIHI